MGKFGPPGGVRSKCPTPRVHQGWLLFPGGYERAYMHKGGLDSPPSQGKMYRVGGEKRENGKIRQKYENRENSKFG